MMLFSFGSKSGSALLFIAACAWSAQGAPRILAHLPSEGVSAVQLSVREVRGREYLYVRNSSGAYTVIDVSRPARPRVASQLTSNANSNLQELGSGIAVQDTTNTAPPPPPQGTAPRNMNFVDTSNPAHPRPIPELSGATSMATDHFRGLLYVSNRAGLWVVYDESLIDPSVKAWLDFTSAP